MSWTLPVDNRLYGPPRGISDVFPEGVPPDTKVWTNDAGDLFMMLPEEAAARVAPPGFETSENLRFFARQGQGPLFQGYYLSAPMPMCMVHGTSEFGFGDMDLGRLYVFCKRDGILTVTDRMYKRIAADGDVLTLAPLDQSSRLLAGATLAFLNVDAYLRPFQERFEKLRKI